MTEPGNAEERGLIAPGADDSGMSAAPAGQVATREGERKAAEKGKSGGRRSVGSAGGGRQQGARSGTPAETSGKVSGGDSAASETASGGADPQGSRGGSAREGGVRRRKGDLRKDLRDFASARPQGWNHDDWIQFLESLHARGHNIEDREEIGRELERERLDLALSRIDGVPAKCRKLLVERFGTVWKLRSEGADEIATLCGISPEVAERVRAEI